MSQCEISNKPPFVLDFPFGFVLVFPWTTLLFFESSILDLSSLLFFRDRFSHSTNAEHFYKQHNSPLLLLIEFTFVPLFLISLSF